MVKIFAVAVLIIIGVFIAFSMNKDVSPESNINSQKIIMKNEGVKNDSVAPAEMVNITVLYDNNLYQEGLETGHGFACLIQGTEKNILFDTGNPDSILLGNMEKLGIDPNEIDTVVLSHIHSDHTGGLDNFLAVNPEVTVYLPQSFPESFKNGVKEYGADIIEITDSIPISNNVYSTGELGISIKEQSLVVDTKEGLIVITGCAHPGIVKIVEKAKELFNKDIYLAMGGFHLYNTSKNGIEEIISGLNNLNVQKVGPCHCSGDFARELFKDDFGENFVEIGVGKRFTIVSSTN